MIVVSSCEVYYTRYRVSGETRACAFGQCVVSHALWSYACACVFLFACGCTCREQKMLLLCHCTCRYFPSEDSHISVLDLRISSTVSFLGACPIIVVEYKNGMAN